MCTPVVVGIARQRDSNATAASDYPNRTALKRQDDNSPQEVPRVPIAVGSVKPPLLPCYGDKASSARRVQERVPLAGASGDKFRQAFAVDAAGPMIGRSESDADHANLSRHPARVCHGIVLARSRDHGLHGKLRRKTLPAVRSQKHDAVRGRLSQVRQWHAGHVLNVVHVQGRALTKKAGAWSFRCVIRRYEYAW